MYMYLWFKSYITCMLRLYSQYCYWVKVNVKLSVCFFKTKHHPMKAYWRSGGRASRIIDLDTRCKWVVSFTLRPLYRQGKSPRYPLDRRLAGSHTLFGRGGEEINSQPLPEEHIFCFLSSFCTIFSNRLKYSIPIHSTFRINPFPLMTGMFLLRQISGRMVRKATMWKKTNEIFLSSFNWFLF